MAITRRQFVQTAGIGAGVALTGVVAWLTFSAAVVQTAA